MHYELWGLHPANLIDTPATEAEGLALIRGLVAAGWKSEDLVLNWESDPEDAEPCPAATR